jgi:hypothetical protein
VTLFAPEHRGSNRRMVLCVKGPRNRLGVYRLEREHAVQEDATSSSPGERIRYRERPRLPPVSRDSGRQQWYERRHLKRTQPFCSHEEYRRLAKVAPKKQKAPRLQAFREWAVLGSNQ